MTRQPHLSAGVAISIRLFGVLGVSLALVLSGPSQMLAQEVTARVEENFRAGPNGAILALVFPRTTQSAVCFVG